MTVFSDRAAYLHVGAMMGTIMTANVWFTIILNQRRSWRSLKRANRPQPELAYAAKRCSKHNTLMSMPLLFTMLSNHYPSITLGASIPFLLLAVLIPAGAYAAYIRENA